MKLESGPKEGPDCEAIEVYGAVYHWRLREQDVGFSAAEVCRKREINNLTSILGTRNLSAHVSAKELSQFAENTKIRRLLVVLMLDYDAPQDRLSNKLQCRPRRVKR